MRSRAEYEEAKRWLKWGLNDCEVSRMTGVPRSTIRDWRRRGRVTQGGMDRSECPICQGRRPTDSAYVYLLGLYLGDGCISPAGRTQKMRVTLDIRYPNIIDRCAWAIDSVRPLGRPANFVHRPGCVEVVGYWNHWSCLFPQHGPGRKHHRVILLESWQQELVDRFPGEMFRGLFHSDGCRDENWVNGKSYPRYQFTNFSADIQEIYCRTAESLGLHWTRPYWKTI